MKQRLKILIVADSQDDAQTMLGLLEAGGYELEHERVERRTKLVSALESDQWDVVLCNHLLSQLSPVEALRTVRSCDQHVPLIVIANSIPQPELVQLVKLGVQDIVLRDNLARLKTAIERELAEAQSRRYKHDGNLQLIDAIESVAEGIALFNAEDQLVMCNQQYRQILDRCVAIIIPGAQFEYILRQAVANSQFEDLEPDPQSFIQRRLARHNNPGEPIEQKFAGNRWIRIEEKRTHHGGIIIVLTDVTQRNKLDVMKNEFISVVSHELRTPLTSIIGALTLLNAGGGGALPAKATAMVGIAHKNSERLGRLINDILDLRKIEFGMIRFDFVAVNVQHLLEQAVQANRAYAETYNVAINLKDALGGWFVLGDHDRLMQVFANLLSNAAKYSGSNSAVTVGAIESGEMIRFYVADKGRGIPDSFRSHVFQTFSQADASDARKSGGSGLGLSIAKAIVEKHGGVIGFDSVREEGTTFYFDLPIPYPEVIRIGEGPSHSAKIPICDDDADAREFSNDLAADLGYGAETGTFALEARQLQPVDRAVRDIARFTGAGA